MWEINWALDSIDGTRTRSIQIDTKTSIEEYKIENRNNKQDRQSNKSICTYTDSVL